MSDGIPEGHVKAVCRLGQGSETCASLVFGGEWRCAKADPGMEATIRARVAAGKMNAQADNCSGPPGYEVEA